MVSQIQPHFLYNTIATFKALCKTDPDKATFVAENFGQYLRDNLDSLSGEELIPVEKELDHTRVYAEIEMVRFENVRVEYGKAVDNMTQSERMSKGLVYDACDPEIIKRQRPFQVKLWKFNQLTPFEADKKEAFMKELFAECGEYCYIDLPFHASWGGSHIHLGTGVYVNTNVTMIDDGHIYIGDRVLIGPSVTIATANHPLNPLLRRVEMQYLMDVHIGDNAWIGAGAIIVPGVHIGKNTVIGAGAVVTRDIPDNVLAVGNPARIVREIGVHEEVFFHRDMQIDWENLTELVDTKIVLPKFV